LTRTAHGHFIAHLLPMSILDEMQTRIVPGDGAMGTLLLASGVPAGSCLENLCVSQPELVAKVHADYIAAGARLIRTNSFGANAVRLLAHGLEKHVNEINWTAAQIARQEARGKGVTVAGSVGPLGISAGEAKARGIDREAVFREQIGALLDGGSGVIFLETFLDPDELALALYVKQSLHHCPAVCSMACAADGRLPSGASVFVALEKLRALDADIVGLNCVNGPETMVTLLGKNQPEVPFAAFPNAGLPVESGGRFEYALTPARFAESAKQLASQGARLIGGCCGTTPEHIAAMVAALGCTEK
jgi:methionine synthase / methylenetetrahydrofolate reductase(NADPH)